MIGHSHEFLACGYHLRDRSNTKQPPTFGMGRPLRSLEMLMGPLSQLAHGGNQNSLHTESDQ